jgi:hypothetical protein
LEYSDVHCAKSDRSNTKHKTRKLRHNAILEAERRNYSGNLSSVNNTVSDSLSFVVNFTKI